MTWKEVLKDYMNTEEYKKLEQDVFTEYAHTQVFPPKGQVFNALKMTEYEDVKCVIIGQDPYHDDGQAMGLCFSVNRGVHIPPSLKNIYKEIDDEFSCGIPSHGDLTDWAKQGVLLLNAVLTVRAHQPASHNHLGWEKCTDEIIKKLNDREEPIVFMLWGNFAKQKASLITNPKHLILTSGHPSPLSVRFFSGNGHFKKCNEFLKANGQEEINWKVGE